MIAPNRIENLYSASAYKKLYDEDVYSELEELTEKTKLQVEKMHKMKEGQALQIKILNILKSNVSDVAYKNRNEFTKVILNILPELKDNKTLLKGVVLALSEEDYTADKYYDRKGNVESDPDLKDAELIPFKQNNDDYYEREVKPFLPDAWLETEEDMINIGCEINFNRYFYEYKRPEKSSDVISRLKQLEIDEKNLEDELYGRK